MTTSSLRAGTCRIARHLLHRWIGTQPAEWDALRHELDLWSKKKRQLLFWWRDDDARTASPALDRLLDLAARFDMPLALAVIPVGADDSLARRLTSAESVRVFQHGWDHVNHVAAGRPAELGESRDPDEVQAQLIEGRRQLDTLFGPRFLPVLVPPFNQLARHLGRAVESAGYRFISSQGDYAGLPLPSRNTHLDVIDWQRNQAADPAAIVRMAIAAIKLRRYGLISPTSPVGMVTHHLAHDETVWRLIEELLDRLTRHPAVSTPQVERLFAP